MREQQKRAGTVNIPNGLFKASDTRGVQERRLVSMNTDAVFQMNRFTLTQVLMGRVISNGEGDNAERASHLLAKLAVYAIDTAEAEGAAIPLERAEVAMMVRWLEKRMKHCESEREERIELTNPEASKNVTAVLEGDPLPYPTGNPKFNPDTYIAQRLLLLDMKEWMFGEILD